MPRTVWEQTDPRFKDDPRWNNESYLRGCAEEAHFERQRKKFHIPLYINAPTETGADAVRPVMHLTMDEYRAFCWKDCAIYGNAGITGQDNFKLLDAVYREWFPHRATDKDISDGSFFAKFMQLRPPAASLREIALFHRKLCDKLQEIAISSREGACTFETQPSGAPQPGGASRPVTEYRMRESFGAVWIVINAGWEADGVLLMTRDKQEAERHQCFEEESVDRGDLEGVCVFRCSLRRAMRLVVSRDPERTGKRAEYNELLEEMLGETDGGLEQSRT